MSICMHSFRKMALLVLFCVVISLLLNLVTILKSAILTPLCVCILRIFPYKIGSAAF